MDSLKTIRQFSEKHPAFSPSSLRQLIFYAETNGFKPAIVRVGRKVLLDEKKFFEIIEAKNPHRNSSSIKSGGR